MEEDLKKANEKIIELEKENGELKISNTKLGEDLKGRDTVITDMKKHATETAQNFKKLRDMTTEEKEKLSEKEIELMKRQEEHDEKMAKLEADQQAFQKSQRDTVINKLADKYARGDADLAEKIKINLGKLKDSELAVSEEALTPLAETAFNMLGMTGKPDPLREAHNTGGQGADYKKSDDFSETQEGKDVAKALGLTQALPAETKDNK